jgi:chromosome condensin MukBEF ATPase and DNA-binding subunit MukB
MAKRNQQTVTDVPPMMPPAEPPDSDVLQAGEPEASPPPSAAVPTAVAAADVAGSGPSASEIEQAMRLARLAGLENKRRQVATELEQIEQAIAAIGDPIAESKPLRDALHAAQKELAETTATLRAKVEELQQKVHEQWHGTKTKEGVRVGGMARAIERENLLRNKAAHQARLAEIDAEIEAARSVG